MITNVYIDGFNFYYACYKTPTDPDCANLLASGPYKWLNFRALAESMYPNDLIHRVHYCTAMVRWSPLQTARQEVFIRALRHYAKVQVHLGHHEERPKYGALLTSLPCQLSPACFAADQVVKVMTREEKGTDVNVANYLLKDAFLRDFEQAMVISNDSDLASAIRVARVDAGLPIHVVSPRMHVNRQLRSAATSASLLDKTLIPQCQLPDPVTLPDGHRLTKPIGW